jgi:hypothetical protein
MSQKLEIRSDINPKTFFPDAKHIITYAFTIRDRHYFRFDDPLSTGYDRALKCLVYYKEMEMNIDRDFIKAHTQAIDNIFLRKTLTIDDLLDVRKLNNQLKQRLDLPKEPDLMYKLASVVFFDQFENPQVYEFKYGEKKIAFWKKSTSLTDFFLTMPLMELIPYLKHAAENLQQFSEMTQKNTQEHLDNLLPMLSSEQKTTLIKVFRSSLQQFQGAST